MEGLLTFHRHQISVHSHFNLLPRWWAEGASISQCRAHSSSVPSSVRLSQQPHPAWFKAWLFKIQQWAWAAAMYGLLQEGQLTLGQGSGCQWNSRLSKGTGICPHHVYELWERAWDGRFAELHAYSRENQGTALALVEIWALMVEANSAADEEKFLKISKPLDPFAV